MLQKNQKREEETTDLLQMVSLSDLQVPDVERLLVDVDGVCACSQAPHSGQVATVAPHGLDDEDPPLGATGRLLDAVTRLSHAQSETLLNQQTD